MDDKFRTYSEKFNTLRTPKGEKIFLLGTVLALGVHYYFYMNKPPTYKGASFRYAGWLGANFDKYK